jgi:hypothetical protein
MKRTAGRLPLAELGHIPETVGTKPSVVLHCSYRFKAATLTESI